MPAQVKSAKGRGARERSYERGIEWLLAGAALLSVLTTAGIVIALFTGAVDFFNEVPVLAFVTGRRWTPLFTPKHFGVLPLVSGTLLVTVLSAAVALPIGVASAIYLSEYASSRVRSALKPILEVLAGIPTVVYGYFALTFVTPLIRAVLPQTSVFNALSASVVLGIMLIPMVASLSEDAMRAVPRSLREGAYALGSTRFEVSTRVVVPAALSGIVASFILALSRAVGETMIVAMAAGATPRLTLNPLESIQTMTSYIVQVSLGDTPVGSTEYKTLFAVGFALFLITFAMNILGRWVLNRYREVYD